MTDFISNTTGTAAGVLFYRSALDHTFWVKGVAALFSFQEGRSNWGEIETHPNRENEKIRLSV
jgi:hypothetical protein